MLGHGSVWLKVTRHFQFLKPTQYPSANTRIPFSFDDRLIFFISKEDQS